MKPLPPAGPGVDSRARKTVLEWRSGLTKNVGPLVTRCSTERPSAASCQSPRSTLSCGIQVDRSAGPLSDWGGAAACRGGAINGDRDRAGAPSGGRTGAPAASGADAAAFAFSGADGRLVNRSTRGAARRAKATRAGTRMVSSPKTYSRTKLVVRVKRRIPPRGTQKQSHGGSGWAAPPSGGCSCSNPRKGEGGI